MDVCVWGGGVVQGAVWGDRGMGVYITAGMILITHLKGEPERSPGLFKLYSASVCSAIVPAQLI